MDFRKERKKLYIPLNSKAYKAYTKGNIAGLNQMGKHGVDFVWAKMSEGKKKLTEYLEKPKESLDEFSKHGIQS